MAREFRLPELGEAIEHAVVSALLVRVNDHIAQDQGVVEVETDKATAEVPCPFAGTVREIRVKPGDEIRVGQLLLVIDEERPASAPAEEQRRVEEKAVVRPRATPEREKLERAEEQRGEPEPEPASNTEERVERAVARAQPPPPQAMVPAAPAVRRLARELGVDISEVTGTGPGGRLSVEDVKSHVRDKVAGVGRIAEAPAGARAEAPGELRLTERRGGERRPAAGVTAAPQETVPRVPVPRPPSTEGRPEASREPMSSVRRKTFENLSRARDEVVQVTQFDRADITELEAAKRRLSPAVERAGGKLTITAIALKTAATALRRFPRFAARIDGERMEIVYPQQLHIGVAVDTERGLVVPVLRDVDEKGVTQIAVELTDISERARAKKLSLEEMRGACFTVTNLGGLGTTYFSPVVFWPEVAILGVGRAAREAVWVEGAFVARLILPLSLSYDHRIIDGADAARFLRFVAEALEEPLRLVMESPHARGEGI